MKIIKINPYEILEDEDPDTVESGAANFNNMFQLNQRQSGGIGDFF